MSEVKKITMLSLQNLAFMAQSIIIKAIENYEFILKETNKDSIEIEVQGVLIRLFYSGFKQAFEQNAVLDDLSETDCLRCYISIQKGTKAFDVLRSTMINNTEQAKRNRLEKAKNEVYNLELELDLTI